MQSIITIEQGANKPSCTLKAMLFSYYLIPGKSSCGIFHFLQAAFSKSIGWNSAKFSGFRRKLDSPQSTERVLLRFTSSPHSLHQAFSLTVQDRMNISFHKYNHEKHNVISLLELIYKIILCFASISPSEVPKVLCKYK